MTEQPPETRVDAAARYKEIIGLARKAAEDLRAWEQAREQQLHGEIAAAEQNVHAAAEAEQAMAERARRWWSMARDNVARLSWLDVGEEPTPVASARGDQASRYADDIRPAYHELTQAVLKLGWRARK
ncbi:hypothetical protein [Prauserella rugosa]|uniref:Uncharacterized protein n=1 Tax=Prauserella rugosa TaxID=43354 RepID=A0A660CFU3_9PSEU|nr:hypothetical protein [Prauserella rugosa]KMS85987.1 hypothetical protein ACZ91_39345 [Streptomyces regensis]TWH21284.1 hypothetical protein JD82_03142 [Prauserella rugosa]